MKLETARIVAQRLVNTLKPHCDRIEIGGSIRRGFNQHVKDIEIICIPKLESEDVGLFAGAPSGPMKPVKGFIDAVNQFERIKGDPWGKYTKRSIRVPNERNFDLPPEQQNPLFGPTEICLDLFMCKPNNWGWIFLVRTGSRDFSHEVIKRLQAHGYTSTDGVIHTIQAIEAESQPIDTPEEIDVFRLIGLDFIQPIERETITFMDLHERSDAQ